MRWGAAHMANGEPWQARVANSILTTQGLGALLSIVLVGFLIWGVYRLVIDVRDVGQQQVLQQERLVKGVEDANEHLRRIEAQLERIAIQGGQP